MKKSAYKHLFLLSILLAVFLGCSYSIYAWAYDDVNGKNVRTDLRDDDLYIVEGKLMVKEDGCYIPYEPPVSEELVETLELLGYTIIQ